MKTFVMKKIFFLLVVQAVVCTLIFISCKKEYSCENCGSNPPTGGTNKSPISNAGADQTIILPIDSVSLDGSASSDPDGTISSFQWTKISGPASFAIITASAARTSIKQLVTGVYQFELKVTDTGGLFSKDTVQVTVKVMPPPTACENFSRTEVNAQLIAFGNLSQPRVGMAVASAGNKIVFAGGMSNNINSSRVDIYDIVTQTWSTAELSEARYDIAAVAAGNKIFFGGGEIGDGTWPVNTVDIYDVSTNTWTVAHLSGAGNSIKAATIGDKVFFAGGDPGFNGTLGVDRPKQVDIYDISTQTWSTALLSSRKGNSLSAVAANNKVYFAGGDDWRANPNTGYSDWYTSNTIDIYDNATNTWSTSLLTEGMAAFAAISVANKIYWAGGITGSPYSYVSCVVEIRDVNTGNSSIQYLAKRWTHPVQGAVMKDNKIVFYRGNAIANDNNKFDIYDVATNTWSVGVLPVAVDGFWNFISVNNTIYVAGVYVNGVVSTLVYKLEF